MASTFDKTILQNAIDEQRKQALARPHNAMLSKPVKIGGAAVAEWRESQALSEKAFGHPDDECDDCEDCGEFDFGPDDELDNFLPGYFDPTGGCPGV